MAEVWAIPSWWCVPASLPSLTTTSKWFNSCRTFAHFRTSKFVLMNVAALSVQAALGSFAGVGHPIHNRGHVTLSPNPVHTPRLTRPLPDKVQGLDFADGLVCHV